MSQYTPEEILDAAIAIRHYLPVLVGSDAQELDDKLSELITLCKQGEGKEPLILEILSSNETTWKWVGQFLEVVECFSGTSGFERLPGITNLSAPKYVCPHGDYSWFRYDVSEEIPVCKTHKLRLVLLARKG